MIIPDDVDCVIVVNVQSGLLEENTSHILDHVHSVVDCAVDKNIPVVATRFINDNPLFMSELSWDGCESADEQQIDVGVAESASEIINVHDYDASREIHNILSVRDMHRPLIMGLETDTTILSTVMGLFDVHIASVVDLRGCATTSHCHDCAASILPGVIGEKNIIT